MLQKFRKRQGKHVDVVLDLVGAGALHQHVHGQHRFHGLDAWDLLKRLEVVLVQPSGRHSGNIRQARFIEIVVRRQFHVRTGGADAREKGDADGGNAENGKQAHQRALDFPA